MAVVDNIRQDLKAKIREQVFRTGEFLPTFQKLATTYKTSTNSIYRAIKQLERENMVLAVKGSGTKVIYASPTAAGRMVSARYVGLVISEPSRDAATMQLLTGIQEGLEKQGRNCVIKFSHKNLEEENKVIMDLLRDGIHDIILYPSVDNLDGLKKRIDTYRQMEIRLTFINYYRANLPISAVCLDNYWGMYNLCQAMHENGAKDFLFVNYDLEDKSFDFAIHERTTAFREYTRANDLPSHILYFPLKNKKGCFEDERSHEIFCEHLKLPNAAVVCMNDVIASNVQKMLSRGNIAWPRELYFGSFGNLDNFPHPYYEARIDFYHFGLELANACTARADSSYGKRMILDTTVVVPRG
jgi:DNA-binding LacI/PurR family transcriptional regulator